MAKSSSSPLSLVVVVGLCLAAVATALPQQSPVSRQRNSRQRSAQATARQNSRDVCSTFDGGINMCTYDSHESMVNRLETLAARNPELAKTGRVGKSKEGRDLVYIKISGDVSKRSIMEPMFKFVANMHGDETIGRELLIYMAEYLVNNYHHNPRVQNLVDTTEIFLMPTMNPDGFSRSREGTCEGGGGGFFGLFGGGGPSGRENANGVDLNRDFPKQYEDRGKSTEALFQGRQPETQAMMRWILSNPFVLSANMHAGAVVASYPFDDTPSHRNGLYGSSPDDDYFRHVASTYASNHAFMSRGDSCRDNFPGGITNGAKWYDVPGGMQDFNYVHSNCFEITLELSCCKHPSSQTLVQEWLNNKESMLKYMESVHLGVKGLVVDQDSQPVPNAVVRVIGNEKLIRTTGLGEYWRLLAPGSYQLVAEAPGYAASEVVNVNVEESRGGQPRPVIHRFVLQRA